MRGLLLACVVLAGCSDGLKGDQAIVRDFIQMKRGSDPVKFVRWWAPVSAKEADFATLFAAANKAKDSDKALGLPVSVRHMDSDMIELLVSKTPPTSLVRVQFRTPNKAGQMELSDSVYYLKDGTFAFSWAAETDHGSEVYNAWIRRMFP